MQGFGVLGATAVLTLAEFPTGVSPGDVPEEALFRLGAIYAPSVFIILIIGMICLKYYKIDRNLHKRNLSALADTKQDTAE